MWGVYKMSASAGSAKTLVADPLATTSSPLLGLSSTPSFSPDSTEIVFANNAKVKGGSLSQGGTNPAAHN